MPRPQFQSVGAVQKFTRRGNTLDFHCQRGRVSVAILSDSIVRVRATQANNFDPDFSYAVAKTKWPKVKAAIRGGKAVTIRTKKLLVTISKAPFRIEFAKPDGTPLNGDERAHGMGWEGTKGRSHRQLAADEMFFGCGEKTSPLNKRGSKTTFWNKDDPDHTYLNEAIYVSIPFLISTRPGAHYGIFWDNTHRTHFNLGQVEDEKHYILESDAGEIDYYFFAGDSVREVVRGYAELTGRMWMPPRWALGFQQCRWSYMSAAEIMDVARDFRKRKIPCDVIYCDIDYMDGYRVFTWNPQTFPKPRKMIQDLARMGFKLVTIIDPGVKNDNKYAVCRDGREKGMFLKKPEGGWFTGNVWPGECVFPDFTNPRVRQWWGPWHKELLDVGVAGIWNDMNEPAVWNHPGGTMPLDIPHDYDGQPTTHERAHNVYGFNMARACHEALRGLRPNQRPFLITRSAYAGIQRYSMVWTGDNQSLWEQLAVSIPECLNLSLSGVPFCGPDVGGFGGDCTGELLARWTQAGAFFPFFRNHTALHTRRQEPWAFGRKVEDVCRRYISLRYQLLPYFYNLFHEAAVNAAPIMRPLFWEFPDDPHGFAVDDQFLLGASLLVAPIIKPGARQRAVYLPDGSDWYDYWTKQKHGGGQHVTAPAPFDTLPLFVRAGSIIPMTKPMEFIGRKSIGEIILDVYPGKKTVGCLYEDDGESFDYERGAYSLTHFSWADGRLKVDKNKTGYKSAAKKYRVRVSGA
ncbi:MAG TPA: glycoside hydrolase family 31 protein [Verrucomicrobiae bacterium]|nr:glycoside hydrolase family 31 protein [Verrucomicrobiae bacterium]